MAVELAMAISLYAQEEPKLVVKPSGRILFDATYVNPQHQEDKLNSGVGIPDMRVGVGFTYGPWKEKRPVQTSFIGRSLTSGRN